jgi:hypothetical protein
MSVPPGTFVQQVTLSTRGDIGIKNTRREATEAVNGLRNCVLSVLIVHAVPDFNLKSEGNAFVSHMESQALFIHVAD